MFKENHINRNGVKYLELPAYAFNINWKSAFLYSLGTGQREKTKHTHTLQKKKKNQTTLFSSLYPGPPLIFKNTNILTFCESSYAPLKCLQCLHWSHKRREVLLFQKHPGGPWEGRMLISLPSKHMYPHSHIHPSWWFPAFFKENQEPNFISRSSSCCGRSL